MIVRAVLRDGAAGRWVKLLRLCPLTFVPLPLPPNLYPLTFAPFPLSPDLCPRTFVPLPLSPYLCPFTFVSWTEVKV